MGKSRREVAVRQTDGGESVFLLSLTRINTTAIKPQQIVKLCYRKQIT